jgi:hypothetical protein
VGFIPREWKLHLRAQLEMNWLVWLEYCFKKKHGIWHVFHFG